MLITKTVKVRWNGSNREYYELKGYIYTKYNDEFEVKVEDLSKCAKAKVDVQCDKCGKIIKNVTWSSYLSCLHEDGKYYDRECGRKVYLQNKVLNGKSFYDWCYDNLSKKQADEIIARWDYELNGCSPKDILYSSHGFNNKGYWFKCLDHPEHESELKNINSFTNKSNNLINSNLLDCDKCNSFAQYGYDNIDKDFLSKYWDWEKNEELGIDPWKIPKNYMKKVWIKCQEKSYHGSYPVTCAHFITSSSRCPYCCNYHGQVHRFDSLGWLYPEVFNIWSEKNTKSSYDYSPNSAEEVHWKCKDGKHDDYPRKINNSNTYKFRCPECMQERTESMLQEGVRLYLESLGYTILHEYKCIIIPINPKTKYQLPFDNEIIDLNLIIEVHGIQHYEITNFHKLSSRNNNTTPEYELYKNQLYDRYKKFIAYKRGYEYLEIPYWTDDENETWKKLINDKINKIVQNKDINKILLKNKEIIRTRKLQEILKKKEIKKNKLIKRLHKLKSKTFKPKRENFKGKNNPRARQIICLNTKEIFDYMKEASEKYNIDNSNLTKCCKKKVRFAGKDPTTKEYLQWMYYDEYIKENNL